MLEDNQTRQGAFFLVKWSPPVPARCCPELDSQPSGLGSLLEQKALPLRPLWGGACHPLLPSLCLSLSAPPYKCLPRGLSFSRIQSIIQRHLAQLANTCSLFLASPQRAAVLWGDKETEAHGQAFCLPRWEGVNGKAEKGGLFRNWLLLGSCSPLSRPVNAGLEPQIPYKRSCTVCGES